jgi:hypothetical protein
VRTRCPQGRAHPCPHYHHQAAALLAHLSAFPAGQLTSIPSPVLIVLTRRQRSWFTCRPSQQVSSPVYPYLSSPSGSAPGSPVGLPSRSVHQYTLTCPHQAAALLGHLSAFPAGQFTSIPLPVLTRRQRSWLTCRPSQQVSYSVYHYRSSPGGSDLGSPFLFPSRSAHQYILTCPHLAAKLLDHLLAFPAGQLTSIPLPVLT